MRGQDCDYTGLKEADAFQRLVSDAERLRLEGAVGPQRSRRLSASGMRRPRAALVYPLTPQRSRRLSASGMRGRVGGAPNLAGRLKEADAFQRLVYRELAGYYGRRVGLKEADAFQRLVYEVRNQIERERVHYGRRVGLKEADAFQRLVCDSRPCHADSDCTPQRSRRLSASGMRAVSPAVGRARGSLKEADAFQRLVSAVVRRARLGGLSASKKQTPFSVWYVSIRTPTVPSVSVPQRSRRLSASGIHLGGRRSHIRDGASKKQTPFSVWYRPDARMG